MIGCKNRQIDIALSLCNIDKIYERSVLSAIITKSGHWLVHDHSEFEVAKECVKYSLANLVGSGMV